MLLQAVTFPIEAEYNKQFIFGTGPVMVNRFMSETQPLILEHDKCSFPLAPGQQDMLNMGADFFPVHARSDETFGLNQRAAVS